MPRSLPLSGSLVANEQADVAANASGRVVRTFIDRGSMVRRGDPLVQLDVQSAALGEAEAQANLESADAHQHGAQAQCRRNDGLLEKDAISRDEWERIDTQCKTSAGSARAARARAALARKTLADGTVRAPFAGMVGERFVSVGEYVQAASKVASLVQLTPVRLQLSAPEVMVGRITRGQRVSFRVQAFPGEEFTGTIAYLAPAIRPGTRDLVFEALVPNADVRLRPGMFADAAVQLPDEPLPAVPRTALRTRDGLDRLFLVADGRVEERIVQTGPERGGYVTVLEGVRAGNRIVTQPGEEVRDGVPVR
jgi:RND family efflux transporter MFP subunit